MYNQNRKQFVQNSYLAKDWRNRFAQEQNRLWKQFKTDKNRVSNLATNAIDRRFSIRDIATQRKAECLVSEEYFDSNGQIQLTQAKNKVWGDGKSRIHTGLTRYQFENWKKHNVKFCQTLAPFRNVNPKTRVRRGDEAVELYLYGHFNCRRMWGYSTFHYSNIDESNIHNASSMESAE